MQIEAKYTNADTERFSFDRQNWLWNDEISRHKFVPLVLSRPQFYYWFEWFALCIRAHSVSSIWPSKIMFNNFCDFGMSSRGRSLNFLSFRPWPHTLIPVLLILSIESGSLLPLQSSFSAPNSRSCRWHKENLGLRRLTGMMQRLKPCSTTFNEAAADIGTKNLRTQGPAKTGAHCKTKWNAVSASHILSHHTIILILISWRAHTTKSTNTSRNLVFIGIRRVGPIFRGPLLKRHGQTTLASRYVIILLRLCSTDGPEGLGVSSCAAPFTRVCAPNLRRADIDGRRCTSRPDERCPKSRTM
jgi:hypothetical protein